VGAIFDAAAHSSQFFFVFYHFLIGPVNNNFDTATTTKTTALNRCKSYWNGEEEAAG
jgi:hypothetical protein